MLKARSRTAIYFGPSYKRNEHTMCRDFFGNTDLQEIPATGPNERGSFMTESSKICSFLCVPIHLTCKKFSPSKDFIPSACVVWHLSQANPSNKIKEKLSGGAAVQKLICGRTKFGAIQVVGALGGIFKYRDLTSAATGGSLLRTAIRLATCSGSLGRRKGRGGRDRSLLSGWWHGCVI